MANIQKNYASSVKRGRFTQESVDECLKRIQPAPASMVLRTRTLAIEAVFEGMALKKEVLQTSIVIEAGSNSRQQYLDRRYR